MKILQVVTRGDVHGGAQTHVFDLSVALSHAGHEVTVITGRGGVLNQRLAAAGIPQRSMPSLVRPIRPWHDIWALAVLFQQVRALRPELICAHTAKAGWLARIVARSLNIPSTFTPHGWSLVDRSSSTLRLTCLLMERLAGATGARIINVCEHERALAAVCGVAPASLLEVVHNGLADLELERETAIDLQPPRIVMVARYETQKNHEILIRALAGLEHLPWDLTLIGEGERRHFIRRLVHELGLSGRTELLPADTDVAKVLASSQICVLSSNFEAFPISILEAMRAGVPVIASDVGGIPEAVIHGKTGLLVPPKNIGALRKALERLIQEPGLRGTLGSEGRARFCSNFTADRMVARTLDVYARACLPVAGQQLVAETT
jgi:glycosyltransferase involved in cell wall biosynthesis